ncbi:MAG: hypothetical protein V4625_09240 [Pseudomonadota bacterium]
MKNYQHPHLSGSEKRLLSRFGNSTFLESLLAFKKWRPFYLSSFKRSVRTFTEQHAHFSFKGHIDLPPDFVYRPEMAAPRGREVNGQYFSTGYDMNIQDLPEEIRRLTFSFRGIVENYFAAEANACNAQLWRNIHVPPAIAQANEEVFADAFHQDLVIDQYNLQLFILLQDTTAQDGPFEYLDGAVQRNEMDYYRKRDRKVPLSTSQKLVGKRGDYLLFTTGLTLHKAGVPDENHQRDIMSIAFFPTYTNIGKPLSALQPAP